MTQEIELTPEERAPLDEIGAMIQQFEHQRVGMIRLLARLKTPGVANAGIDYQAGKLIITPVEAR